MNLEVEDLSFRQMSLVAVSKRKLEGEVYGCMLCRITWMYKGDWMVSLCSLEGSLRRILWNGNTACEEWSFPGHGKACFLLGILLSISKSLDILCTYHPQTI